MSKMISNDGVWRENEDKTWSQDIPLPFYGLKNKCGCGRSFWKVANYEKHYKKSHTDGKIYKRTPTEWLSDDQ
jgi:hypothetical protein